MVWDFCFQFYRVDSKELFHCVVVMGGKGYKFEFMVTKSGGMLFWDVSRLRHF